MREEFVDHGTEGEDLLLGLAHVSLERLVLCSETADGQARKARVVEFALHHVVLTLERFDL